MCQTVDWSDRVTLVEPIQPSSEVSKGFETEKTGSMGRIADRDRKLHLQQYFSQIVGEGVEEYYSKIGNIRTRCTEGTEGVPEFCSKYLVFNTRPPSQC